jgi:cysteine desulfurase / selenocysteine lyase
VHLTELLSNETLRQSEFPVTCDKVFLAHAAVAPLPHRVATAIRTYAALCTRDDQETILPPQQIQRCRDLAARLLNARPEEIAIIGPTSLGLSLVAAGLAWRNGDNVLFYPEDYPSNVYPWMALARHGVEPRQIKTTTLGQIQPQDVLNQINHRTRLVALASCHFISGHRIDLQTIGTELRKRNVLFCVDAIQTLGAFPTTVEYVDFLAADAHKWLLGPCAAGLLYVRKEIQEQLNPVLLGWHNVKCPNFVALEELVLRHDARRYEAGSQNLLGLTGLHASLELLLELNVNLIANELLRKRNLLLAALLNKGYNVLGHDSNPSNASAILSFSRPGADLEKLHQTLAASDIVTSLRTDRAGNRYLRISPHCYNSDAELHRFLDAL